MQRTFKYRAHITVVKYISAVFAVLGLLFIVAEYTIWRYDSNDFGLYFGLGMMLYFGVFYFVLNRMSTLELSINNEGIRYRNHSKDFFIKYEEIEEVNTRSINSLGGYFIIKKNNKEKVRVTVVLRGISEFVKILRKELDERGLDIYNNEKLHSFYKTAVYSDISFKRVFKYIIEFVAFGVLSGILMNIGYMYVNIGKLISVHTVVLIGWLILYLTIELGFISRKIRSQIDINLWNLPVIDEKRDNMLTWIPLRVAIFLQVVLFIIGEL